MDAWRNIRNFGVKWLNFSAHIISHSCIGREKSMFFPIRWFSVWLEGGFGIYTVWCIIVWAWQKAIKVCDNKVEKHNNVIKEWIKHVLLDFDDFRYKMINVFGVVMKAMDQLFYWFFWSRRKSPLGFFSYWLTIFNLLSIILRKWKLDKLFKPFKNI